MAEEAVGHQTKSGVGKWLGRIVFGALLGLIVWGMTSMGDESLLASLQGGKGTPPEVTWFTPLFHHRPGDFIIIAILVGVAFSAFCVVATRRMTLFPTGAQNIIEMVVEGFNGLCVNVMGEKYGKKYAWLIGSLFLYIILMNYIGLAPGFLSPTAHPFTTLGLAVISLIIVHTIAIKENGIKNYLLHYVDKPYFASILTTPLHIIGEIAKVLSLSIRLFGNVFGEDTAIFQFAVMGIMVAKGFGFLPSFLQVPLPFQIPMVFLHLLVGAVQAFVFSLLVAVYISIFLPHEEHGEQH